MDSRTLATLLRTLGDCSRPVRSFSESTAPDGTTSTTIEFSDGPAKVAKEDERPSPIKKDKIPDYQLATRRAPLFEAGKPQ
jgi:hypothetical protein